MRIVSTLSKRLNADRSQDDTSIQVSITTIPPELFGEGGLVQGNVARG